MTDLDMPGKDNAGAPSERPRDRRRLARSAAVGFILAMVVVTGLALFGDLAELGSALSAFDWWLALPIFLLTLWNYLWRFVKWEMYLRVLEIGPLGRLPSALVFLSAFSMSLTPGKVGELIKSIYLRRFTGAPINRSSAIVAAERVTDAIAMLLLATIGLWRFSYGRPLLLLLGVVLIAGIALLRQQHVLSVALVRARAVPVVGGFVRHGIAFIEASGALYRTRVMALAVGLGVVSWLGECVAFFLILHGLGVPGGWNLFLAATFVLAVSSLAGGASMLPGGLGVADASIAAMLLVVVEDAEMTRAVAVAATLLIRFATLWFAVLLGAVALVLLERGRAGHGSAVHN